MFLILFLIKIVTRIYVLNTFYLPGIDLKSFTYVN